MIFASRKSLTSPDGELLLVHPDRKQAISLSALVPSLRVLLENWEELLPSVSALDQKLRQGELPKKFPIVSLSEIELAACLPRTWLFADGSAYLNHIQLVRKARGAEMPPDFLTTPLLYQAESSSFLGPKDIIPQVDVAHGTDFEAEVGVILDDVPMGVSAEQALQHIRLVTLINDVSLRGLIPKELAMGFGFFVSKPQKALAPFALTLDELLPHWRDGRLYLDMEVDWNDEPFGRAHAGEMHFHFGEIIAHAAQTRPLVAGTLIGSGTVSNVQGNKGYSCIVEKRVVEQINSGQAATRFLQPGDRVHIRMRCPERGISLFGDIEQTVVSAFSK